MSRGPEPHMEWGPKDAGDAVLPSLMRVEQPHAITRADAASQTQQEGEDSGLELQLQQRDKCGHGSGWLFVGVRREPLKWSCGAAR